jgi:TM2 domain-containing membrane protein YozV
MPLRHTIILIVCVAACCAAYAQSNDPYSYNAIAGFANQLVEQREYYRAYQEYHRLYSYYPAMYPYDAFYIASLYCHYQGKQYQWVLDHASNNSMAKLQAWVFVFDSAFNSSSLLPRIIDVELQQGANEEFQAMILKRKLAYSLLAVDNYNELSPYMPLAKDFDPQRIYEYSTFTRDKRKNPYAAMGWGIIPGAGYIYSDDTPDGIIAAIVIGVCAVVTYFAVDTGNSGIAVFTGAAGAFFYGGSILGGYLAAKRTNNQIMKELTSYLEEELKFAQDREIIFNRYGKPKAQ